VVRSDIENTHAWLQEFFDEPELRSFETAPKQAAINRAVTHQEPGAERQTARDRKLREHATKALRQTRVFFARWACGKSAQSLT